MKGKLFAVFLAMFGAQAIGSVYNITYNLVHIGPLLTEPQKLAFEKTIQLYNFTAYPFFVAIWGWVVFSLAGAKQSLRRRAINLPWWATAIGAAGWLFCLPALFWQISATGDPVSADVKFHLPVSVLTAMAIALSLGYLSIDWLRHRLIFPYFFDEEFSPGRVKGGLGLSVTGRGVLWIISASLCPIIALLLLLISPSEDSKNLWFAVGVASAGVFFAIAGTLLLRTLVADPVTELRAAAQAVGKGDLNVQVENLRADEFGILADEFNTMVAGLREKEEIRTKFGMHVGEAIANELLKNEAELAGVERTVSVLFSDIRSFTTRCENLKPKQAVQFLNVYHETMTRVINEHHGIVNQLVGDGLMSIFGATGKDPDFAKHAVEAGRAMLQELDVLNPRLEELGFEPVQIGVGVNTGQTVVGTIGSPGRMEYTAIGDTVNTAARIEGMTKDLQQPLLISETTWNALAEPKPAGEKLPPQPVRGRAGEIQLYSIEF
ncbi:MAG: HAMP domain-containing protein [Verrucomicrobiales bacterium]|nr:HAMP domain-containing protein [Verrucomicrobiales bacterium]